MPALALRALALSAALLACGPSARSTPPGASATTSGGAPAAAPLAPEPCAPASDAFCWVNPLPQGSPLVGLWGARPDEAWAVGPEGALLRWDGRALATVAVPTAAPLRAVWGSAADDAWAVGDAVLHWDGRGWTVAAGAPAGPWSAVHGSSRGDVWLVGAAGAVAHFDGANWSRPATPVGDDLAAVAAVGPGEAWAAAARGGAVLRWDGATWSVAARLAARSLSGLFAAGPGDVWAAGEALDVNAAAGVRGTALTHLVGGVWTPVSIAGLETAVFSAVHGSSAQEVWVVGSNGSGAGRAARFDGTAWHLAELPGPALPLRAVLAFPGAVLAAGEGGQAFVGTGAGFTAVHQGPPGYLQAATVSPSGAVWFAGALPEAGAASPSARLLRLAQGAVEAVPVGVADVLYGVWASSPTELWAGTLANGFLHFDGQGWTARVGGYAGLVDGVWASGPADVWGVAGATALHYDGATVTAHPLPGGGARRIFGLSPRDVWAVGGAGVVQRWDGATWTALAIPGGPALAVWASAADDVWMVGEGGLALRWDGQVLARVDTGTSATLWAVGGTGRGDVWVAGAQGTVLHFDGAGFTPIATGTRNQLAAIAVTPAGQVYVAGEYGTILRRVR